MVNPANKLVQKAGPCLLLSYNEDPATSWLVPNVEKFAFGVSQSTKKPVELFFKDLNNFILTSTDTANSTAAAVVKAGQSIADLLGVKLFNRYYYAQSWSGSEPATFNVTLNFFRGMSGLWSSKIEVWDPIMDIMSNTVPQDKFDDASGVLSYSPLPSSLNVFSKFGSSVLNSTVASVVAAGTGIAGFIAGFFDTAAKEAANALKNVVATAIDQNIGSKFMGIWSFAYGWWNGRSFSSYVHMKECIVNKSNFTFSPLVEKVTNNGKVYTYPISGVLTLSCSTEFVASSRDFGAAHNINSLTPIESTT